jgi:uncharacterized OB-fold protein
MNDQLMRPPPINPEAAPFFEAAAQGRFIVRRCLSCEQVHWYPRVYCPFCTGETEWIEGSGKGVIYSFSVMRRVDPPYAIAYVVLDEGPSMMTNLVDCDFSTLAIGQRVRLVFKPSDGGHPLPCFTKEDHGRE